MQHMLKFKAGMFSWSLLTITTFCAATPAFAQSQAPSQDAALQNVNSAIGAEAKNAEIKNNDSLSTVVQNTTPANGVDIKNEVKNNDSPSPKTGSLELSDSNVQFLKSFNDRHKCGIANIDAAISRADFANNIVVCLTSTEVKLAQDPNAIPASELAQLRDVVDQFSNEVSYLGNRLETVEKKLAAVQKASTFSTTTKLAGEVIVGLSSFSGNTVSAARNNASGLGNNADTNSGNIILSNRVRLNFDTSFSGKDRLRTRLQSRNTVAFNGVGTTSTNTTRLGYDGDNNNTTDLSLLQYTLPIFNNSKLIVETVGSEYNENMFTFNPLLASAGTGSISRFGRYNPVYRQSGDGAAATADFRLSPEFSAAIGYAVPSGANTPGVGATGLFGSGNSGIVQLRYQPSPDTDLGLSFARSYHPTGSNVSQGTGSIFASSPFGAEPTVANHYSFLASTKLSPGFVLSGWVGLTNASLENGGRTTGNADIFNAAITAAITDVGGKGNTLGFIIGIPPQVSSTSSSLAANRTRYNPDTALHLETLYKIKVSDNLDITPGVLLITNPESAPGQASRGSEFVGTVRTTFRF
jgi:Carbohydrate-selective porin, OprB family